MNDYKKYILTHLSLTVLMLLSVVAVNYFADPANLYGNNFKKSNSPAAYADVLVRTSYGLQWPNNSWNERDIKISLAKKSFNYECAVIGSSHVMQFSSERKNIPICKNLINLGVSGGGLEDYMIFSYVATNGFKYPKKIVFGIDPWSFDLGRDVRWKRYKEYFYKMLSFIESDNSQGDSDTAWNKYINLINPYYFMRSLNLLGKDEFVITRSLKIDPELGGEFPIFLPDGSLLYSLERIAESRHLNVPKGGVLYKIKDGQQFTQRGVDLFEKLIRFLEKKGIEVIIVMTPYHPNVWLSESKTRSALIEMESVVRNIAKKDNIDVYGTYNPNNISCPGNEFIDHMHAKSSCLEKIFQ